MMLFFNVSMEGRKTYQGKTDPRKNRSIEEVQEENNNLRNRRKALLEVINTVRARADELAVQTAPRGSDVFQKNAALKEQRRQFLSTVKEILEQIVLLHLPLDKSEIRTTEETSVLFQIGSQRENDNNALLLSNEKAGNIIIELKRTIERQRRDIESLIK